MESEVIIESKERYIDRLFRDIDERNNKIIKAVEDTEIEFRSKIKQEIKNIQFRNKIDKIKAAYALMINENELKEIEDLTEETSQKLLSAALKKNKNEKEAISSLFDPSSNIEI